MTHILDQRPSILDQYLYELRHKDIQKEKARFRYNLKRIGVLMAMEISRHLQYDETEIVTPLGVKKGRRLADPPVLVNILRAGQPLMEGFQEVFSGSECGFIGAFRAESDTGRPEVMMHYHAIPDLNGRTVIVVDPMLATGNSMVSTLRELSGRGASVLHLASVVAAPEGIRYIQDNFPGYDSLWIASLDDRLNKQAYIVPGLGDAGDLSYGIKL